MFAAFFCHEEIPTFWRPSMIWRACKMSARYGNLTMRWRPRCLDTKMRTNTTNPWRCTIKSGTSKRRTSRWMRPTTSSPPTPVSLPYSMRPDTLPRVQWKNHTVSHCVTKFFFLIFRFDIFGQSSMEKPHCITFCQENFFFLKFVEIFFVLPFLFVRIRDYSRSWSFFSYFLLPFNFSLLVFCSDSKGRSENEFQPRHPHHVPRRTYRFPRGPQPVGHKLLRAGRATIRQSGLRKPRAGRDHVTLRCHGPSGAIKRRRWTVGTGRYHGERRTGHHTRPSS